MCSEKYFEDCGSSTRPGRIQSSFKQLFCISNDILYTAFHDWFKKTQMIVPSEIENNSEQVDCQ